AECFLASFGDCMCGRHRLHFFHSKTTGGSSTHLSVHKITSICSERFALAECLYLRVYCAGTRKLLKCKRLMVVCEWLLSHRLFGIWWWARGFAVATRNDGIH